MIIINYPAIGSYSEASMLASKLGTNNYRIHAVDPRYLECSQKIGYVVQVGNKIYFNDPSLWMTFDFALRSNIINNNILN